MAPFSLNKQIAHCNLPFNWLTSLVMDLAACVICGAQNDTNECHLADFTVDAVSANHFMASYHPNRDACSIDYTRKNI